MNTDKHRGKTSCLICVYRCSSGFPLFKVQTDAYVERHATLLALIEAADRSAVLAALAVHGDRSFVEELNGDGTDAILQV